MVRTRSDQKFHFGSRLTYPYLASFNYSILLIIMRCYAWVRLQSYQSQIWIQLNIYFADIAWTYFLMQNLDHFKDAAWRIDQAEKMLKNSHGPNQERLIAVKGGACPEMVIYARLFLLQAIVAYHSQSTSGHHLINHS